MDFWPVFVKFLEHFDSSIPRERATELLIYASEFLLKKKLKTRFRLDDLIEKLDLRPLFNLEDQVHFQGEAGLKLLSELYRHRQEYHSIKRELASFKEIRQQRYLDLMYFNSLFFEAKVDCHVVQSLTDSHFYFVSNNQILAKFDHF